MSLSDPIADMLNRLRNGQAAGAELVEMPSSRMKAEIARILKKEGYVRDYVVEGGEKKTLRVYLKYTQDRQAAIRGVRRESSPGLRRFVGSREIPRVLGGLGTTVISTSSGLMTGREAKSRNMGGEIICSVW